MELEKNYKKKIAFVTWIGESNFGTCLQSYALHKKLELLGYDVCILVQKGSLNIMDSIKSRLKRVVKNNIHFFKKKYELSDKYKKYLAFRNSHYNIVNVEDCFQLSYIRNYYDVFISGSDQIWNTYVGYNPFFFLEFAGEKKKISYASSIGTRDVNPVYKDRVCRQILKFKHVGIREKIGADSLKKLSGRDDIVNVLDPTFLLTIDDWTEFCRNVEPQYVIGADYVFCYFIGNNNEEYSNQLRDVLSRVNLSKVIIVPSQENKGFSFDGAIIMDCATPIEFVYLLSHAKLVITDSFHATAFSINMGVQFVEFLRFKDCRSNSQNSRIFDLLGRYGLNSQIYSIDSQDYLSMIDYKKVHFLLSVDQCKSEKFLVNSIEN